MASVTAATESLSYCHDTVLEEQWRPVFLPQVSCCSALEHTLSSGGGSSVVLVTPAHRALLSSLLRTATARVSEQRHLWMYSRSTA